MCLNGVFLSNNYSKHYMCPQRLKLPQENIFKSINNFKGFIHLSIKLK